MPTRILIIDDDPPGLLALSELIQRRIEDVTVDTALDVHAALDFLKRADYYVVISDIRMAGLDGFTLLNQVQERWPDVPVILITAAGRDREAEALREGAYAFIEKPLAVEPTLGMVRAALERSRLRFRVRHANRESLSQTHLEAQRLDFPVDPSLKEPQQ